MKYTKAWLNYEKAENAPEDICVTLSERGPVADSIRRELELAFPAMYGVTPVFRDTAEDASLAVTFDCNMACGLGEEGYRIEAVPAVFALYPADSAACCTVCLQCWRGCVWAKPFLHLKKYRPIHGACLTTGIISTAPLNGDIPENPSFSVTMR